MAVQMRWWQARVLPPSVQAYEARLSAGSPASMGRPSGIEPDLPGPRPGVLPLPLRPPWSTRRESNPQPTVCGTAARPVELLVVRVGHLGVEPSDPRVSGGCLHRLARARHAGPGGVAPPSPGFRPGACAVSATGPRWNGTWVLPHSCWLVASCASVNTCPAQRRVSESNRVKTWSAATCLAVRPTRRRSEGRARTCATWLTARHGYRYITSDQSLKCLSTVTGDRTRPSGMRPQRRLQLTLTAWRKAKESNPRALPRHPCFRDRLQSTLRRFPSRKGRDSHPERPSGPLLA